MINLLQLVIIVLIDVLASNYPVRLPDYLNLRLKFLPKYYHYRISES